MPILAPTSSKSILTSHIDRFDQCWSSKKLSNGMTAIHAKWPQDDRFFLGVMVRTGSRFEANHPGGISHFLEHMQFRGSKHYPTFDGLAQKFEWLGGDWNAETGQEYTFFWHNGLMPNADPAIELFSDFLGNPAFRDIEVEREIILQELQGEQNEYGHSIDLDHHIANLMWPNDRIGLPILGNKQSITTIAVEDLHRFRDEFYVPLNSCICVVGGEDSTFVFDMLERHFGSFRKQFEHQPKTGVGPLSPVKDPRTRWVENTDNEFEIQLSFRTNGEWSEDAPALEMISRILADGFSSRLSKQIRESKGLVYEIDAITSLFTDAGTLDITASVGPENVAEYFNQLTSIIGDLVANGPTEEEFSRSIHRSIIDLQLVPTEPDEVGSRLCWFALSEQDPGLTEEADRIAKLSREQVVDVCRHIFTPQRTALVALGPDHEGIDDQLRHFVETGFTSS